MPKNDIQKKKSSGKLTAKQKQFVEFLSNPDNKETPSKFAKRIKVTIDTLNKWKADSLIVQSAFQLCVTRLGAEMPKVLKMLLEKALIDKDIAACKLYFQQLEKITEIPDTGMTIDDALKLISDTFIQNESDDRRNSYDGEKNEQG
jgi:hypothetical protein